MSPWIFVFIGVFIVTKLVVGAIRAAAIPDGSTNVIGHPRHAEWTEACTVVGLDVGPIRKKRPLAARGTINGMRVSLEDDPRGPEIEVDFRSGVPRFDIRPAVAASRTKFIGVEKITTGDVVFDAQMAVHAADADAIAAYLSPLRREAILALNAAVLIDEIDHDELEVRLTSSDWTSSELVEAVNLVVQVAQILGEAPAPATPQDTVRSSPNPQDAVS